MSNRLSEIPKAIEAREPELYQHVLDVLDNTIAKVLGGSAVRHFVKQFDGKLQHCVIVKIPEEDHNRVVSYPEPSQELARKTFEYCFKGANEKPDLPSSLFIPRKRTARKTAAGNKSKT